MFNNQTTRDRITEIIVIIKNTGHLKTKREN